MTENHWLGRKIQCLIKIVINNMEINRQNSVIWNNIEKVIGYDNAS